MSICRNYLLAINPPLNLPETSSGQALQGGDFIIIFVITYKVLSEKGFKKYVVPSWEVVGLRRIQRTRRGRGVGIVFFIYLE